MHNNYLTKLQFDEVKDWLESCGLNIQSKKLDLLPGDCGHRRYIRCHSDTKSYIFVHSIPNDQLDRFLKIGGYLAEAQLTVPIVYKADLRKKFLLLQDFGDNLYYNKLSNVDNKNNLILYNSAMQGIIKMQTDKGLKSIDLPLMDVSYIKYNLSIFKEWFLIGHLHLTIDSDIENLLYEIEKIFINAYNNIPWSFVHIDYQSKNLFVMDDGKDCPGIIDFQDASFGPVVYDLLSLLQDAYIVLPEKQVNQLINIYYEEASRRKILQNCTIQDFLQSFYIIGAQRHVKNLGIFARLKYRDNKPDYIFYIKNLLFYLRIACKRYQKLWPLNFLLENIIAPHIHNH